VEDAGAHPFVARVARALAARPGVLAGRDGTFREAAVALVLRPLAIDDAELLLIRRAERADDPWSGQIALPGGGFDPGDTTLDVTAVRETREEVGLDLAAQGQVLGALDDLRPRSPHLPSIIVRPFVTIYHGDPTITASEEVAEARWIPLSALWHPSARARTTVQARGFAFEVDAVRHGDFTIWGMTERILAGFEALVR
jgi:8-oxo-dGTP pyrophosphatase MutT (NUDIX family)